MSRSQTYERIQLYKAEIILQKYTNSFEERVLLLECFAGYIGGISVTEYWKVFKIDSKGYHIDDSILYDLKQEILKTDISIAMAISSLIREPINIEEQKKQGAFYTDYRLAEIIAKDFYDEIKVESKVVDFAAGTGILLVGIAQKYKEKYKESFNEWIQKGLYAYDLSEYALRGATVAIMSMTSNLSAIRKMVSKWKMCDSLLDEEVDRNNYDIVVGNPPWGKLKLSRHSFARREGTERIYGSDYNCFNYEKYEEKKNGLAEYRRDIKEKYSLIMNTEPDMYMAFLEKAISLANTKSGKISFLVPAGLIRSKGTKAIRKYLLNNSIKLKIRLFDNKAKFFAIDSRFKFLMISIYSGIQSQLKNVVFSIGSIEKSGISFGDDIIFNTRKLKKIRPDLTIPEVKTVQERDIFYKVIDNGIKWGKTEDIWKADISREVDMTNDRKKFVKNLCAEAIPVVEGRMVQQYRFGVKSYISGSGRSAVWTPCAKNGKAQFYMTKDKLNKEQLKRITKKRVGYCDIAGQTNERAMMSTIIPAGVICGNKVPTIIFPNAPEDILYLWIGITNSFVFDWMIRRVISTTINYFLLFNIPMPKLDIQSKEAKTIINNVKIISSMGEEYYNDSFMQNIRAEIDILVAQAYGLTFEEIKIILNDFPIMDRKQPAINREKKSTITRDSVLSMAEQKWNLNSTIYTDRYRQAKKIGAHAYIPTEMTILSKVYEGGE